MSDTFATTYEVCSDLESGCGVSSNAERITSSRRVRLDRDPAHARVQRCTNAPGVSETDSPPPEEMCDDGQVPIRPTVCAASCRMTNLYRDTSGETRSTSPSR